MDYQERQRYLETFRGRRFVACRAVSALEEAIRALPEGPYSQLALPLESYPKDAREEGLPGTTAAGKQEMLNLAAVLLGMVLNANDGKVSTQKLLSF